MSSKSVDDEKSSGPAENIGIYIKLTDARKMLQEEINETDKLNFTEEQKLALANRETPRWPLSSVNREQKEKRLVLYRNKYIGMDLEAARAEYPYSIHVDMHDRIPKSCARGNYCDDRMHVHVVNGIITKICGFG